MVCTLEEDPMSSSIIHGKYVISRVIDEHQSIVFNDGAVFQVDGNIVDIGYFDDIRARYEPDEIIGSQKHMVIPGRTMKRYLRRHP